MATFEEACREMLNATDGYEIAWVHLDHDSGEWRMMTDFEETLPESADLDAAKATASLVLDSRGKRVVTMWVGYGSDESGVRAVYV